MGTALCTHVLYARPQLGGSVVWVNTGWLHGWSQGWLATGHHGQSKLCNHPSIDISVDAGTSALHLAIIHLSPSEAPSCHHFPPLI